MTCAGATDSYLRISPRLLLGACFVFAANFAVVAVLGSYDVHLGWLHLASHECFKPLLYMNAAFVLSCLFSSEPRPAGSDTTNRRLAYFLVTAVALLAHWQGLTINFSHHDWNHAHITGAIHSISDVGRLFSKPQGDGFYRPLTFLSLLVDYRVFGNAPIAYHLHNLVIHIANAILVGILANRLGYGPGVSTWAAVLYSCSSPSFEPVIWPAARFDLLATLFSLLAILSSLEYLRRGGLFLVGAGLSLVAALLNKEIGYAVPLIIAALIPWRSKKAIRLLAILFAICLMMVAVRILVYGGLGGYPGAGGQASPNFTLSVKTFTTLFTRLIPLSVAVVNVSFMDSALVRAALLLLPLTLVATCLVASASNRQRLLIGLVLVSGIPVTNLIGWLGPTALNSRYLYFPAVWVAIFIPAVLARARWRTALLIAWVSSFVAMLWIDQHVYRTVIDRIPAAVALVKSDVESAPATTTVEIHDVPLDALGVFFFRSELEERLTKALPGVRVTFVESRESAAGTLSYSWSPHSNELISRSVPH